VNLNMIDTIGSGIRKIFQIQKSKFFPLPDYDISNNRVQVQIFGKILDINYARKIAQIPSLTLSEIFLLDKVSKQKTISSEEASILKAKNLIEGRKPNYHISSELASASNSKADYIKQRGIDDAYCKKMILDYLTKFKTGKKTDFETVLLDKLPDVLDISQKKNKIKNNLQLLKKQGLISPEGKSWRIAKP
jgi:ATP-dependent DNA helicase RecG